MLAVGRLVIGVAGTVSDVVAIRVVGVIDPFLFIVDHVRPFI